MIESTRHLDAHCLDCRVDTREIGEYYMVTDEVWYASGVKPHGGVLCVGCLEKRIERRLTPDDFPSCALNMYPCFGVKSNRLANRMGARFWERD